MYARCVWASTHAQTHLYRCVPLRPATNLVCLHIHTSVQCSVKNTRTQYRRVLNACVCLHIHTSVVGGVWWVVCGVWCVVLWCVVCGVWCVVCGVVVLWCVVCVLWSGVSGVVVCDLWSVVAEASSFNGDLSQWNVGQPCR